MGSLLAVHVYDAIYMTQRAECILCAVISIKAVCADEGDKGTFKHTFEFFHNIKIDVSKQIKPVFKFLTKRRRRTNILMAQAFKAAFLRLRYPHRLWLLFSVLIHCLNGLRHWYGYLFISLLFLISDIVFLTTYSNIWLSYGLIAVLLAAF